MSRNSDSNSGGIGFSGALTLLFIGLKIAKVISWSWWWVLSPLWISISLWLIFVTIIILIKTLSR